MFCTCCFKSAHLKVKFTHGFRIKLCEVSVALTVGRYISGSHKQPKLQFIFVSLSFQNKM